MSTQAGPHGRRDRHSKPKKYHNTRHVLKGKLLFFSDGVITTNTDPKGLRVKTVDLCIDHKD